MIGQLIVKFVPNSVEIYIDELYHVGKINILLVVVILELFFGGVGK